MTRDEQNNSLVPIDRIESMIYIIRGQKVMLDADLAALYGVETRVLVQAIMRNRSRFPNDFMFQLSLKEATSLISQIVISKKGRGGRRKRPYAFTEHGIVMLSSVLRSERAIQINIAITRTFVRIRKLLVSHKELSKRLDELEKKYDDQFQTVFEAIRQLIEPSESPSKQPIGFQVSENES